MHENSNGRVLHINLLKYGGFGSFQRSRGLFAYFLKPENAYLQTYTTTKMILIVDNIYTRDSNVLNCQNAW